MQVNQKQNMNEDIQKRKNISYIAKKHMCNGYPTPGLQSQQHANIKSKSSMTQR